MKPKPENWKFRATNAEELLVVSRKTCDRLRVERDAAERRYQEMVVKAEMNAMAHDHTKCDVCKARPIVEKRVLPLWVLGLFLGGWGILLLRVVEMDRQDYKLQTPIREPYAVTITKYRDSEKLKICQDSWREDEAELKVLRRKWKDRNEGTTYVE
jgi:hypothetical protein